MGRSYYNELVYAPDILLLLEISSSPGAAHLLVTYEENGRRPKSKSDLDLSIGSLGYGLATLFSISKRFYRLTSPSPFYRPLRSKRWELDYFQYNMMFGFLLITLIIILSVSLPKPVPRLAAMPHTVLIFQVSLQLIFATSLVNFKARFPFTFSSMPRSEPARSGVYIIMEDVVAVDGGQGIEFRRLLDARYRWSEDIRRLLHHLDLYWGLSGLVLATLLTAAIFTIPNHDAVFVIGKLIMFGQRATAYFTNADRMDRTLDLGDFFSTAHASVDAEDFAHRKDSTQATRHQEGSLVSPYKIRAPRNR